ncbi:hypothetical protein BLNAU_15715 [Blattamonas nauphoetae]|uniref:Uncharacterized protein n=1 Tax=Blattamonas nauphoetae TaxID=2049346 RepID=A0ABQ9XDN8_9EUKA|nr:hypothetical protein BLNAU_15715 [Blattamonas nauphoetae]
MKSLTSLLASICEAGVGLEWQDLMECFVCAVIGLESKASWSDNMFHFDWDDVIVDGNGTTRISEVPPSPPQSFSAGMTSLSHLFLAWIEQLSESACLPSRINQHSRDNLVPRVLFHILNHLVIYGHVVPICDASKQAEIVGSVSESSIAKMPYSLSLFDALLWLLQYAYLVVNEMEDRGLVDHSVRLTDLDCDVNSPQYKQFVKILEPELAHLRTLFDPDLFEEAERDSLWLAFLQEVVSGEEVVNDTSFLKVSFFRPTLLSLQAQFQEVASSEEESEGSSTSSSLNSSLTSPHTSLEAHLNSSLRTNLSSPHFKQESLKLLTIFHSLLTSPLHPSLPKQTPIDLSTYMLSLYQIDDLDPTERFDSSMFDEEDDEILAQSLIRCRSVCDLVGPDKCVDDVLAVIDRTVSVLGSSNSLLRLSALSLFSYLEDVPCVLSQLPRLWNRLRSAFHDGWPEEQHVLIRMSTMWIIHFIVHASLQPFPVTQFDWDGLSSASFGESFTFLASVTLLMLIRRSPIDEEIDEANAIQLILSFEQQQHALSRIVSILDDEPQYLNNRLTCVSLLSYCILISLRSSRDFPIKLTTYLTTHPDFDFSQILIIFENILLILCHNSQNPRKPHQPPLDLIFERLLRTNPDHLFAMSDGKDAGLPNTLVNTSLCGFHAICRRGVHFTLMESELVRKGQPLLNSFWMFLTPLISDTFNLFLYFPPPLVVRFFLPVLWLDLDSRFLVDGLKVMMITLLLVTAPFGDNLSLKELFRSDRHRHDIHDSSADSDFISRFQSLEWLNIPTGFESALAYSNPHDSFNLNSNQNRLQVSPNASTPLTHIPNIIFQYLSHKTRNMIHDICTVGDFVGDLTHAKIGLIELKCEDFSETLKSILSPVPAEVSVVLEFVRRLVCQCRTRFLMEMVRFGLLDVVLRGVSESSFLEDYENGICVIGILLRSIRDCGNEQEMNEIVHGEQVRIASQHLHLEGNTTPFIHSHNLELADKSIPKATQERSSNSLEELSFVTSVFNASLCMEKFIFHV